MKTYANLTKFAAVTFVLVAVGLGVQYLNARANQTAVGITSEETLSISPFEMMQSPGQLPNTVVENYI